MNEKRKKTKDTYTIGSSKEKKPPSKNSVDDIIRLGTMMQKAVENRHSPKPSSTQISEEKVPDGPRINIGWNAELDARRLVEKLTNNLKRDVTGIFNEQDVMKKDVEIDQLEKRLHSKVMQVAKERPPSTGERKWADTIIAVAEEQLNIKVPSDFKIKFAKPGTIVHPGSPGHPEWMGKPTGAIILPLLKTIIVDPSDPRGAERGLAHELSHLPQYQTGTGQLFEEEAEFNAGKIIANLPKNIKELRKGVGLEHEQVDARQEVALEAQQHHR